MLGGAVLNATTFIGRSYLAKYLSGGNTDQERVRHDKALEKYKKIILNTKKTLKSSVKMVYV